MGKVTWPDGKKFAFTIFDDTDHASVKKLSGIYSFLRDLGFRTTKSVWTIEGAEKPVIGGDTCENPEYLKWVLNLEENGFEIGLHNVTHQTSDRDQTIRGVEQFKELFGYYPKALANHSGCKEGIYWGRHRLSGLAQLAYSFSNGFHDYNSYRGHVPGDRLFWGDICQEKIKYVRNFVFNEINTLKTCPQMPYHDSNRPYVNYWFAATEGQTVDSFLRTCNETSIEKLEQEGGACIMYAHLAKGYIIDGSLNEQFRKTMDDISQRNGWFVPVGELLDYLIQKKGPTIISKQQRTILEWRWLGNKARVGHG